MIYPSIKRIADIIFAIIGIIFCTPIILICCILLILSGEFSPLYRSYRVGFEGELFQIFKLRTMRKIKHQPSVHYTDHGDERITLLGKVLRASKLDELPQFLNILSGELSFVGPRPQLPEIFQKYDASTQAMLKTIKPGVTGIGSLLFRDEAQMLKRISPKNREKFYDQTIVSSKGSLEIWYISNISFYTDFKILCFTIFVLFYSRAVKLQNYFIGIPDLEIYAPTKEY